MATIGTRLPDDLAKGIDEICALSKRSRSSVVREALETFIEDRRDYYLALKRLEEHKASNKKTFSLDEVAQKLDSGSHD